jgi:hypothetical protein
MTMNITIEGEAYRVIMNDQHILSAVRPEGERKVVVLNWNKVTGEIKRRPRICEWLNKKLKEVNG